MRSPTTRGFRKRLQALPPEIQSRAQEAFRTFKSQPDHQSLKLKQIHASQPVFSARIGRGYRALAWREGEEWVWFWIGSHADYDNILNRL